MIGVAVDGIGALRCGRGVVLVVVGECGCRHVLSAREIEHDVRLIRGFGIRAALGEGGCIGHVARTKLYGAFIEGDITGQIARFRSRVLLACESGGVLCHVDGQIGRTDLERGGTHSPITGRCGRSDVLDRDEHALIIDQIVDRCERDRGELRLADYFGRQPRGCIARFAGYLVAVREISHFGQSFHKRETNLVARLERECGIFGIGVLAAAEQQDTVLGLCRAFGHYHQVIGRNIAAVDVGYDDRFERAIVFGVDHELVLARNRFGEPVEFVHRDRFARRGFGFFAAFAQIDFGAAFAFGERHVVDSEYRCFIDCIFHVEIGRFVFQLEFRGGEYPELVGLCIGVLDCRPAGAVGTQSEVEFLRFELVVVETGIIVDRFRILCTEGELQILCSVEFDLVDD